MYKPNFDSIDSKALEKDIFDNTAHLKPLHSAFDSKLENKNGNFINFDDIPPENVTSWLGDKNISEISAPSIYDTVKEMYSGVETSWGKTTGLKEISERTLDRNSEYYHANLKQQSGFAAEIISTAKENIEAEVEKTGIRTVRADDLPEKYQRNDPYVDKVRMDQNGKILERIQTKFVGKNAEECLNHLTSKKYDKYFTDGQVDKIEVPKDYYDEIKASIPSKLDKLNEQLEHVKADGKTEAAEKIQAKIERYNQIDKMLEKSTVTSDEAQYARLHPERYVKKIFAKEIVTSSNEEGLRSGAAAAALTAAVSTIDNVQKVINGELSSKEAVMDIGKDTAIAGGVGYGTAFVSNAISQSMSSSSCALIKAAGSAGIPASAISFGVESYESVIDYAQGTIDGKELAKDLGNNAANVAGGAMGSALAGAALGSVVPGAGTAAGFAAGMVGGLVGTAVASEAYETALKYTPEMANKFADKAQAMADQTVETVKKYAPEKTEAITSALKTYINENNLPIHV